MSPNINSFVGDLVEMARAMEELPGIKAKLDEAYALLEEERKTVQDRELCIQQLKADGDIMQECINTLEVARDDAELRFLEADERTQRALGFVKTMFGSAGGLIQSLEPPVPEPVVQAQPVDPKPEQTEGAGESHPITSSETPSETVGSGTYTTESDSWASRPGQSEADPIASTDATTSGNVSSATVETKEDALPEASSSEPLGRYSGRRYYDHPTYVPLHDWLDGGGSEEDYNWRPARPNAAF